MIPAYCCQKCGAPIGYLGRFLEWALWRLHECRPAKRQGGES